jgi:hypothetical protein
MPRAGHIRARPLRKMLHAGLSAPPLDALHMCKLWSLVSVYTSRRSLLLTGLRNARTPRCSVCERRFVKRPRRARPSMRQVPIFRGNVRLRAVFGRGVSAHGPATGAGFAPQKRLISRSGPCGAQPTYRSLLPLHFAASAVGRQKLQPQSVVIRPESHGILLGRGVDIMYYRTIYKVARDFLSLL